MQDADSTPWVFCFGEYEADLSSGQLRKRGVKIKIPEQSFQLLAILLRHAGETVTREEMRRRLWPGNVFVDFENNLNTAIARLRIALNDSAEHPQFLETLPKHGYRFIAELYEPAHVPKMPLQRKARLAVLPFMNLSGDPSQDYFSDGMTEEMITELAGLAPEHLGVIARTTAMHYKGSHKDIARIGGELGVDYVLEGSVNRVSDQIRICAQLIQVRDQAHLWARKYEVQLRDVCTTQGAIAEAIASRIDMLMPVEIRPKAGRHGSVNPEAYDAYLRGLYHFNKYDPGSLMKAIECFREAIGRDPGYAPPYARLALSLVPAGFFGHAPPSQVFPQAEAAAVKSMKLDGTLAEAHYALGFVLWFYPWDLAGCARELKRAVEISPNDPFAHCVLGMFLSTMEEDHEEAAREIGRALALDPLSMAIRTTVGWSLYFARQYDRAIAEARVMLEMDDNCLHAWYVLGLSTWAVGSYRESIRAWEQASEKFGDPFSVAWLGAVCGLAGERERACATIRRLEEMASSRNIPAICRSWIHIGLGEINLALDWIEKAYAEHDAQVLWLRVTSIYDPLRATPRFEKLVARLNLPRQH